MGDGRRAWSQLAASWGTEAYLVNQQGACILKKLAATMVEFDLRFEIAPGTKLTEPKPTAHDVFEVQAGAPMAE